MPLFFRWGLGFRSPRYGPPPQTVQGYRRHSVATVRSSPKLREGSRSIVDIVVLDVACSLSVFSESALNRFNMVKPHLGQFLNSTDRHEERAYEGSEPLKIFFLGYLGSQPLRRL